MTTKLERVEDRVAWLMKELLQLSTWVEDAGGEAPAPERYRAYAVCRHRDNWRWVYRTGEASSPIEATRLALEDAYAGAMGETDE